MAGPCHFRAAESFPIPRTLHIKKRKKYFFHLQFDKRLIKCYYHDSIHYLCTAERRSCRRIFPAAGRGHVVSVSQGVHEKPDGCREN